MSDEGLLKQARPAFLVRQLFINPVLLLVVFPFGFVPLGLKCCEY